MASVRASLAVTVVLLSAGSLRAQESGEERPTAREIWEWYEYWQESGNADVVFNVQQATLLSSSVGENAGKGFDASGGVREKVYCQGPSGEVSVFWRKIEPAEVEGRLKEGEMPAWALRYAARSTEVAGAAFNAGLEREGVPVGFLSGSVTDPWITAEDDPDGGRKVRYFNMMNPGSYFAAYGVFFDAMADAAELVNSVSDKAQQFCKEQLATSKTLKDNLKNVGRTQVGDRTAWQLEMNLDRKIQLGAAAQPGFDAPAGAPVLHKSVPFGREGAGPSAPMTDAIYVMARPRDLRSSDDLEYTVKKLTFKIDAEHYFPLLSRVEGVATQNGQSNSVIIEKEETDYRQVPNSGRYESYRQVVRIWGFTGMGPEMEKAKREMAKVKEQLAQLSPEERAMVERTMGDKIRTMEIMAAGGPIVVETRIEEIITSGALPGAASSMEKPIVVDCFPGSGQCP